MTRRAGARTKLPWRLAQRATRSGIATTRPGRSVAGGEDPERHGEQHEAEQLWPQAESGPQRQQRCERQEGRCARPGAGPAARQEHEEAERGHEPGPKDGLARPAARAVGERQDHLGPPLLVEPGSSVDRERQEVDAGQRPLPQDRLADPDLIGEVDGVESGQEPDQRRQLHGDDGPQPRKGDREPGGVGGRRSLVPRAGVRSASPSARFRAVLGRHARFFGAAVAPLEGRAWTGRRLLGPGRWLGRAQAGSTHCRSSRKRERPGLPRVPETEPAARSGWARR